MKQYGFIILITFFLFILLITGCSNQYVESEYGSSTVYLDKINREIKGRNTQINFTDGRDIVSNNIRIEKDSVFRKSIYRNNQIQLLPLSSVKKIKSLSYKSGSQNQFDGSIQLKDDSVIEIYNAELKKDKISYYIKQNIISAEPLSNIRSFSFTDHFKRNA